MSWRDAKVAALYGVPYFDYRVGPPYTTLPNQLVAQGSLSDNHANANPMAGFDNQPVTLPHFAQSRYRPHGDYSHGYHLWDVDEMLIESAPFFIKRKNVYAGAVGSMLHAQRFAEGEDMPGSEIRVTDSALRYDDPGNFMDTLTWGGKWGAQQQQAQYELPK